jgi:hypothetical protein
MHVRCADIHKFMVILVRRLLELMSMVDSHYQQLNQSGQSNVSRSALIDAAFIYFFQQFRAYYHPSLFPHTTCIHMIEMIQALRHALSLEHIHSHDLNADIHSFSFSALFKWWCYQYCEYCAWVWCCYTVLGYGVVNTVRAYGVVRSYIGDQVHKSVKVFQQLGEQLGLKDESMVLSVFVRKIMDTLEYWVKK